MNKVYFASDLHLSFHDESGKIRERIFVDWLDKIRYTADKIFLLGDMFDFWFEYKNVMPSDFIRFWGKLAELTDQGIEIHYFTGNHDMWMQDYVAKSAGIILHREVAEFEMGSCRFLVGHGHDLSGKLSQRILFKLYRNKLLCNLFAFIHPRWGISWGNQVSSRNHKNRLENAGRINANEPIIQFALEKLKEKHYDYFIFGHTHIPACQQLSPQSYYINTGEWIKSFSYAVFDGREVSLHNHSEAQQPIEKNYSIIAEVIGDY